MSRPVALLTDFGPGSVYVGQLHGTLRRLARERGAALEIIDLAHDCPFGDVATARYLLRGAVPHLPEDTVYGVVVDPGVGSERAAVVVRVGARDYVGPDNGLFAPLPQGGQAYRIEAPAWRNPVPSNTFHGRDIFAPTMARLALGETPTKAGPVASGLIDAPKGPRAESDRLVGRILIVDVFGNLITDFSARDVTEYLGGASGRVELAGRSITGLTRTFSDVEQGAAMAYIGSGGHLEVAVNRGSAAEQLGVRVGDGVALRRV